MRGPRTCAACAQVAFRLRFGCAIFDTIYPFRPVGPHPEMELIKLLRNALACFAFAAACGAAPVAGATDFQDAWYSPAENGWGINIVQVGTVIGFAVYVYDSAQQPTWYLGSGSSNSNGTVFSGTLARFTGPWFAGPYNPALVASNPVGTFVFTPQTISTATLSYSVSGVNVTKSLQRLAVTRSVFAGDYLGTLVGQNTACTTSAPNTFEVVADLVFTQSAALDTARMVATFSDGSTCTYDGPYTQEGRYGRIHSTFTCSYGDSGSMDIFELETGTQGFTARMNGTLHSGANTCTQLSRIGGISRAQTAF